LEKKKKKNIFETITNKANPMKTFPYLLSILIASFCITINAHSQDLTPEKKEQITLEITKLFEGSLQAAENFDSEKLSENVDDSLQAGYILSGQFFRTFSDVMVDFETKKIGCKSQKMNVTNKKITVLADNAAIVAASGNYSLALEDGRTLTGTFAYTLVCSKMNGEWKIIHTHM